MSIREDWPMFLIILAVIVGTIAIINWERRKCDALLDRVETARDSALVASQAECSLLGR